MFVDELEKAVYLTDEQAAQVSYECAWSDRDVVIDGKKPIFVGQQGIDMIKILCAIYESAKTGKEVSLV